MPSLRKQIQQVPRTAPMDNAIAVTYATDFSGLRLIQSRTGHVRTPQFTFEYGDVPVADYTSKYHTVIARAKAAFAQALNITEYDVMVSMKHDPEDWEMRSWFFLSTRNPVYIPQPKIPEKPVLPENRGAIDI